MRLRLAPLALLPLLAAAAPAPQSRPDLVIVSVEGYDTDKGIVRVVVGNAGGLPAGPSYLAVQLTGPVTGTTNVQIGAIAGGTKLTVDVSTGKSSISQASYRVIADRSNVVVESNEANNTAAGVLGGKP